MRRRTWTRPLVHLQATQRRRAADHPRGTQTLASAITALQFQDMATQLIAHTAAGCATAPTAWRATPWATTRTVPAVVEDTPLRPNPVTQDEMDAGSIELF
jgi:hypothetical protein